MARIESFAPRKLREIPDGTYQGVWSGNLVRAAIPVMDFKLFSDLELPETDTRCVITAKDGVVTVEKLEGYQE